MGDAARVDALTFSENDDFIQTGELYRNTFSETDRIHLIQNIVSSLKHARKDIQIRVVELLHKCDHDYGKRLSDALGLGLFSEYESKNEADDEQPATYTSHKTTEGSNVFITEEDEDTSYDKRDQPKK